MNYSQLIEGQKAAPEEKRKLYRAVVAGTVNGHYRCGAIELDGRYDVHEKDGAVFFEKWAYDEMGGRVGDIEQRIACAACGGKW